MELSESTRTLAGILVLSLVTVESGGLYLVRMVRGHAPATHLQRSFARAGHAHAGVLLILSLLVVLYADLSGVSGGLGSAARSGVPAAALLMPAGFFLSTLPEGTTEPNRWFVLVYAGAVSLAVGLSALGIGLLSG